VKAEVYPAYRESGTTWYPMIPSHWSAAQLRHFGRVVNGGTPKADDTNWNGDIPFVTPPDLREWLGVKIESTGRSLTEEGASESSVVPAGSVVTSIRAPIGYVAMTSGPSAFNQGCRAVVPSSKVLTRFLCYLLIAAGDELYARGQGTTFMEVSGGNFSAMVAPLPPLDEQQVIADYLDAETGRIDLLIEKQQQLIEKLRERRRTVVADAVEMGIDGDTKLHDSVPTWIRAAPASWELMPLKRLAEVQTGVTLGGARPNNAIDVPYLRVANVQTGGLDLGEIKTVPIEPQDVARYLLRIGDVLMTEGGDIDKLGRGCIWSGEVEGAIHQNHVFAVRCGFRLLNRFLVYVMESPVGRVYFEITAKRSTNLASTNSTTLRNFTFAVPPPDEQQRIADHLDEQTAKIDALILKTRRFIELAKERRAALVTAAVTGQIDVRAVA
jgi:type I restriction enzyme S subunit